MFFHLIDDALLSDDDSPLRTAQQLVSAEQHDVRAIRQSGLDRRLHDAVLLQIHHQTASQVIQQRKIILIRQPAQFLHGHIIGKADNLVVAGVHLHQCTGVFINRPLIIIKMRLIGGPDLFQKGAAGLHDLRNTE